MSLAITAGVIGVASVGASVYGADKQRQAAHEAGDLSAAAGETARSDLSPFRTTGVAANTKLAELLGIGPNTSIPGYQASVDRNIKALDDAHWKKYGMSVFDPRADAVSREAQIAKFSKTISDNSNPYSDPNYGSLLKSFTPGDLQNEPGYQFGLTQGEKALERNASAGGRFFAPSTSQALVKFNQDYAGTKYNDAFSRDAQTKNQLYGFLSGTSSAGQNAAGQTANNGINTATNVGNWDTSAAAADASGVVGGVNAASNAVGGYMNYQNQSRLLDLIKQRSPTTTYNPYSGTVNSGN